jgi:hypothetical protein
MIGAGLAFLCLLSTVAWKASLRMPLIEERFARIREGMSEKQVESIFGGPRGCYRRTPMHHMTVIGNTWAEGNYCSHWYFDDGYEVVVGFSKAGIVEWKYLYNDAPPVPSTMDRLLTMAKRILGM